MTPPRHAAPDHRPFGLSDTVRGVSWMIGTLLCFSLMSVAARELSSEMPTVEILVFRNVVAVAVMAPFVLGRGPIGLGTRNTRLHLMRAVIQLGGQFGWIYGIALLPLAEVTALEFTVPLWTLILAVAFLGETASRAKIAATAAGLIGVAVILRPGFEAVSPVALVVLAGAACFAGSGVLVKYLTRTEDATMIVFYMNLLQLPMVTLPALFVWVQPGLAEVPWIIAWGLAGLAAHYTMARGLRLADITLIFPLDFLRLPLIAMVGWLFYAEALDPWTALGAVIIFAGNFHSVRHEARKETPKET
jgi:drug/metabolite transporter (DMT)-like permease